MREKPPSLGWILAAMALIPAALMVGGVFLPLKDCPACEDMRWDFAQVGVDVNTIKTARACDLCGDRKKVSFLKHREYRSAHPATP